MRDKVKMLIHRIAHKLDLHTGTIWTGWVRDTLMVGFQCGLCGQIDGVFDSGIRFPKTAEQEVGRE